ncbi:MAG: tetratricopeptide repeat protein, partial [Myxococcales bacterium]|nr:tetratricopeptide repeat protein [Myxococcales bacterium]
MSMSTRRRRRWSAALALPLVTALLIHPSAAHADSALAEQLFKDGLALMDQGKVAEACDKFAASMDAEPSGGTALNLGRCNEEQGKMASAWAAFERAATLFRSTGESDREAFAEEQAARVAPQLSRLTIAVTKVPGLTVTRNGEPVPEAALGTAVPVDPGEQVIVASAPGYETATATVTVAAGAATAEVTVPPLVASEEPPAPAPGQGSADDGPNALVITGGVLLGVGGVAA